MEIAKYNNRRKTNDEYRAERGAGRGRGQGGAGLSARGGDRENRAGWRNRMDDQSRTGLLARGENRRYDGPWRTRVGEQNGAVGEAVLGRGYGRER